MATSPNQPYYPPQEATPIQSGVPINSYPLHPVSLNVQPIPQNQNYKPYSLVQHKGIIQKENNTYYIILCCCIKSTPIIYFFMGFSFIGATVLFLLETFILFII